ncbi:MAG: AarF/ABC1/UbiB kinase family protein [bacterium]|nr:AarF/ABC1/UbiB kinase family protein [bacterium]
MRNRSVASQPMPVPDPPKPGEEPVFETYVDPGRQGLPRRLVATLRHVTALIVGGSWVLLRGLPVRERRRPAAILAHLLLAPAVLFVNRELRRQSFPVQLRRRLERLGPTYIKLGQMLSLREDLLPQTITKELGRLLDRLPALPFPQFLQRVRDNLERPVDEVFAHIRSTPLASASIGQIHVATTAGGAQVVLKVVKPGVAEMLRRDALLLRGVGRVLQLFLGRYQPRRVIAEFCDYTLREVDLRREADNAEMFAGAFADRPDIVFPRIYRDYSNRNLLCMEYLDGIQPTDARALALSLADRERLIDLGAEAIVRMLYHHGFFHADLHPANLLILPGPRCGFVDLGTVGRFDADLKHTLMYYFYCLISGDAENAANYLTAIAEGDPGSNRRGFRRDVEEICRHWSGNGHLQELSLARLILQSVAKGAEYRLYFPMEMVLMVKAIVTFEAVGNQLLPGFDVTRVCKRHIGHVILERFSPLRLGRESLTALPELVDALAKTPRLLTEGLRLIERATQPPSENPLSGLRSSVFGGACMIAGAILAGFDGPWPVWALLLVCGLLLSLRRGP